MATDEDAEILRSMREAIHKSRGYASYWEWKLDKQQPELHAARVLSRFLFSEQHYSVLSVDDDPPDALVQLEERRYGIEITEIVDQKAVERASKRKRHDLPVEYDWADWDSDRLSEALKQGLVAKDKKLAQSMIDSRLAGTVAGSVHSDTRRINRAFIILSYDPNVDKSIFPDGCPIFEIKINR